MTIRLARIEDEDLLYELVNKEDSLRWKRKTRNKINKSEHKKWFNESLSNKFCRIWIIQNDKENIGQVRIKLIKNIADVDIYLLKNFRGKGYASKSLIRAINHFSKDFDLIYFRAFVHKENISSINLFKKNQSILQNSNEEKWNQLILFHEEG